MGCGELSGRLSSHQEKIRLILITGLVLAAVGSVVILPVLAADENTTDTIILSPPTFLGNSLALSPDGATFAFASRHPGNGGPSERYELWTMKTDGSGARTLASMENIDAISWNPQGTLLVFGGLSNGTYQVYTIEPDGSNLTRITNGSNNAIPAGFDPTGKKILYTYEKPQYRLSYSQYIAYDALQKPIVGRADLFITDLTGANAKRIVSDVTTIRLQIVSFPEIKEYYPTHLSWISDSRFIVPVTNGKETDLYKYDTSGKEIERMTNLGDAVWSAWNPGEQELAYRSGFDVRNLLTVNRDDRVLTAPAGVRTMSYYDYALAWRPGTDEIAYISYGDAWLVNADSTGKTELTTHTSVSPMTDLVWSPDGKYLYTLTPGQIDRIDINAGKTAARSLTDQVIEFSGANGYYQPVFSPDSSSVAFVRGTFTSSESSDVAETTDIFIFNLQNRTKKQFTSTGDARSPSWSPDGSEIAYTRMNYLPLGIWVSDRDGNNATAITPASDYAAYPSWNPDGNSIAYLSGPDMYTRQGIINLGWGYPRADLVTISPNGTKLRVLLTSLLPGDEGNVVQWNANGNAIMAYNTTPRIQTETIGGMNPTWLWVTETKNPDNQYGTVFNTTIHSVADERASFEYPGTSAIYIDYTTDKKSQLKRLDADGTTTTLLTSVIDIAGVACNPKSSQIAYISQSLWSVDGDGSNRRMLADVTDHGGQVMTMKWSPDGSRIAYLDSKAVWVVNADGSNRHQVSTAYSDTGSLDWSPDGRWISFTFSRFRDNTQTIDCTGLIQQGVIVLIDTGVQGTGKTIAGSKEGAPVPGFTAFAAVMGIAGVIFLVRRRS
jgi:Tol biopolymer transport system component